MFKDLRQNAPFYILYNEAKPRLEIGNVVSVSKPTFKPFPPNQNPSLYAGQSPEMVVEVIAKVGKDNYTFKNLPIDKQISDYENAIVSMSKDIIASELQNMSNNSTQILDSVDRHQIIVEECTHILKRLNPAIAKAIEDDKVIKNLEGEVSSLKSEVCELKDEIRELLNIIKPK